MSESHATLAALLRHNVQVVVDALAAGSTAPLSAMVAARTVSEVMEDVTHALVAEARRAGHTWAEIGQLLRISRQAAQQRFGDSSTEPDVEVGRPAARAVQIVEQLRDHDHEGLMCDWDDAMLEAIDGPKLDVIWERVGRNAGPLVALGRPTVVERGPYRVVDVPLAFEHGPMRARVTFNRDDTVAGLLLLAPEEGA